MVPTALALQNIKTDPPELIDVRMVYLGEKSNLGRGHGVVFWEKEFEFEYPACV